MVISWIYGQTIPKTMAQTALGLLGAYPEDSQEADRGIIRGAISRIVS